MKILINAVCAKKYSGGGFQIALNFVSTALKDTDKNVDWYFLISDHVAEALSLRSNDNIYVLPAQPDFIGTYLSVKKEIRSIEGEIKPDVVYSIVAPSYFSFKSKEVMRYTNPWVAHPNSYARKTLDLKGKLRNYVYTIIHKHLLRKCHYFITQTDYTAKCIAKIVHVPEQNVCVIHNVLPAVYKSIDTTPIKDEKWINVTCVAAPFPHKNLDIIPSVLQVLDEKFGINNIRFHVTMPKDSAVWKKIENRLSIMNKTDRVVNHGRLNQQELSQLYRSAQIMFLPTLLEVFSASLLEAMYFDLKIVASDFPFNSNVIGNAGLLFKPTDAIDAAEKMVEIIKSKELQDELSRRMKDILKLYSDYRIHFDDTKSFLQKVGNSQINAKIVSITSFL